MDNGISIRCKKAALGTFVGGFQRLLNFMVNGYLRVAFNLKPKPQLLLNTTFGCTHTAGSV